MPVKKHEKDEYSDVRGVLLKVSEPKTHSFSDRKGELDYYLLGIKTDDGKRIMFALTTEQMGWGGDFNRSIIWYWNSLKKKPMKTSLTDPSRYLNKDIKVTGFLETVDAKEKKYRITKVQRVLLFLD